DLHHPAGERREQVAHGLHRLHHPERFHRLELLPHRRQLHVHDVAELVRGIARDADRDDPVLETRPLVLGRVAHIIRIRQAILLQGSATAAGLAIPAPVPRLPPAPPAASRRPPPGPPPPPSCAS